MDATPYGALVFGWCTLMAVAPIRRPRRVARLSWISSAVPNELPFVFLAIVLASEIPGIAGGGLASWDGALAGAVASSTGLGLAVVARRGLLAGRAVQQALDDGLGAGWRVEVDPGLSWRLRRRRPWLQILLAPWPFRPREVERVKDLSYGDGGSSTLLDVYRHRSRPSNAPTIVHLHGGGFRRGRKSREARALIHRLARQGWTCVSANYHLGPPPAEGPPESLVDVKRLVAWLRTEGRDHGVDPDSIFLSGSSAGAHLATSAAFTANDPRFQPGFEEADTSICAAIGLYGYYGTRGGDPRLPTTPLAYVGPDAPPVFVAHGDNDTFTPVAGARRLVARLRAVSSSPVVYAELPGAQHSFDLFHSPRFESVVDGIEVFAAWARTRDAARREGLREVGRVPRAATLSSRLVGCSAPSAHL